MQIRKCRRKAANEAVMVKQKTRNLTTNKSERRSGTLIVKETPTMLLIVGLRTLINV
jgi:hypothetical protein